MAGTLSTPNSGSPNSTEDPKIATAISTLNGLLTSSNLLDGSKVASGSFSIVNADVSASAAVAGSKLDTGDGRLVQTTGLVAGSGAGDPQTLTGSYVDVAGCTVTFTPDVACYALVYLVAGLEVINAGDADASAQATLVVDGSAQTDVAENDVSSTNAQTITNFGTCAQVYRVALTAASHTLKVQAKLGATGATGKVYGAYTNFLYQLVAQ